MSRREQAKVLVKEYQDDHTEYKCRSYPENRRKADASYKALLDFCEPSPPKPEPCPDRREQAKELARDYRNALSAWGRSGNSPTGPANVACCDAKEALLDFCESAPPASDSTFIALVAERDETIAKLKAENDSLRETLEESGNAVLRLERNLKTACERTEELAAMFEEELAARPKLKEELTAARNALLKQGLDSACKRTELM